MIDPTRSVPPAGEAEPVPTAQEVTDTSSYNAGLTPPAPLEPTSIAPAAEPAMLASFGGYRIVKLLGKGGMGAVYAAEDVALHRTVALKTLMPDLVRRGDARARFSREARAAAAVESDHIVRIYQVGEDRGVPFIAMEYLRGKSLAAWMKTHTPTLPQILKIGYETATGLAA